MLRGRGGGCQLLTPRPLCQNPWHPCDPWADISPYTSSSTITIIISGTSMLTNGNVSYCITTTIIHPQCKSLPPPSLPLVTTSMTTMHNNELNDNNNDDWHQQDQLPLPWMTRQDTQISTIFNLSRSTTPSTNYHLSSLCTV